MRRAFQYRLHPNVNRERELASMRETHRRLYNARLDGRKTAYEAEKRTVRYTEQSAKFTEARQTNPFYANLNFSSARATMRRLDKACCEGPTREDIGGAPLHTPKPRQENHPRRGGRPPAETQGGRTTGTTGRPRAGKRDRLAHRPGTLLGGGTGSRFNSLCYRRGGPPESASVELSRCPISGDIRLIFYTTM